MKINYIVGDATNPQGPGNKIITHCCNDIGGWGRGFVVALSKKWKEPEGSYREWYRNKECQGIGEITPFELGEVQFVEINHFTQVANLIGQHGVKFGSDGPPVRYEAIKAGFQKIKRHIQENMGINGASIHMPRIGCGLAGGNWGKIYEIIKEVFGDSDISVNVYTLPDEVDDYENLED
jgi:O-acetyl-ADP-ribose deacetylase (regulator of RNase III)